MSGPSHALAFSTSLPPPSSRPPSISRLSRVSIRGRVSNPCRIFLSPPIQSRFTPSRFPIQRWRISCFRNDEGSPSIGAGSSAGAGDGDLEVVDDRGTKRARERELDSDHSQDEERPVGKFSKDVSGIFKTQGEPWTVPWTAETILQVMLLWITSFWFVGSWIIPFLAHASGFGKETLTYRSQALYSLLTDVAEGLAGIAILHRCLSRFRPLPADWFRFSLRGNWLLDVGFGCLLFPLVNRLSQFNISLLPLATPTAFGVASSVEQSIMAPDPVSMALYPVVVSLCAPLWEEIVFRGFLLPSLTRYMPMWCSILVSSVAFALAHFNVQRLLPMVFLGVLMGTVFARSKNLMASILLHSLWNCCVPRSDNMKWGALGSALWYLSGSYPCICIVTILVTNTNLSC